MDEQPKTYPKTPAECRHEVGHTELRGVSRYRVDVCEECGTEWVD